MAFTFNKNSQQVRNHSAMRSLNISSIKAPRVTFSYDRNQQSRIHRNSSLSVPRVPQAEPVFKEVITTTTVYPLNEVIYYPVIHNRLKFVTPQKAAVPDSPVQIKTSRRRVSRSYVSNSINMLKDISTNESREPLTPEQFKQLSDYLNC